MGKFCDTALVSPKFEIPLPPSPKQLELQSCAIVVGVL